METSLSALPVKGITGIQMVKSVRKGRVPRGDQEVGLEGDDIIMVYDGGKPRALWEYLGADAS